MGPMEFCRALLILERVDCWFRPSAEPRQWDMFYFLRACIQAVHVPDEQQVICVCDSESQRLDRELGRVLD